MTRSPMSPNALPACWAPSPDSCRTWTRRASWTRCAAPSPRRRRTRPTPCGRRCSWPTTWPGSRWWPGAKAFGADLEPPVEVNPKDRRFADPAWAGNPFFYGTRLTYLAACRWAREAVGAAPVAPDVARKAGMFVDLIAGRVVAHQLPAVEPRRAQAGVRHGRGRASSRARGSSSTTCATTAAVRARSTPAASRWAATSPSRPRRWCSATTSWSCCSTSRRPSRCTPRRCWRARRGSTSTT